MLRNGYQTMSTKQSFIAFAAMIVFVRALVPAGWMLAPSENGDSIKIQVCDGHWVNWNPITGQTDESDLDGNEYPQDSADLYNKCAFSISVDVEKTVEYDHLVQTSVWASLTIPRPSTGPPIGRQNQYQLPARGPPYPA